MLRIRIKNDRQRKQVTHSSGILLLGRNKMQDVAFVFIDDPYVSRKQLKLEAVAPNTFRIENIGSVEVWLADGKRLHTGDSVERVLPVQLSVGQTQIEFVPIAGPADADIHETMLPSLAQSSRHILRDPTQRSFLQEEELAAVRLSDLGDAPSPETFALWLQTVLSVQHSAAGSDAFYDETASAVVDLVGLDCGMVILRNDDRWEIKAHCTGSSDDEASFSRSVLDQVVAEKRTFYELSTREVLTASLINIEAVVASPIFGADHEVVGVVYGSRGKSGNAGYQIHALEAQVVQLLASAVGAGLMRLEQQERLLKFEHELGIARQIQSSFLPHQIPQPNGWEIAACFRPARGVSGDFYDVFELEGGKAIGIVVADVCDKGVGAALFMALIRTLVRAFATSGAISSSSAMGPATSNEVSPVSLANDYVFANHLEANMFATLFFGVIDVSTGQLTYINGGHEPPAIIGSNGIKCHLAPTGPAIGMFPDGPFEVQHSSLEIGDTLFIFTDGITEARSPSRQFFQLPRLRTLLGIPVSSAVELLELVDRAVAKHVAGGDQYDDITMMAVRRCPTTS